MSASHQLVASVATMKVIHASLMAGLAIFTGVVVVLRLNQAPELTVISYIAAGAGCLMIVAYFALPPVIANTAISQLPKDQLTDAQLLNLCQTKNIIGAALLEGGGFFNAVIYMITGAYLNLGLIAVLLCLLAASFPTQQSVDNWLANKKELLPYRRDG